MEAIYTIGPRDQRPPLARPDLRRASLCCSVSLTASSKAPTHGIAWRLAWVLVAALVVGGVYLALRHLDDVPPAIVARA
jgi:hypothetical protein